MELTPEYLTYQIQVTRKVKGDRHYESAGAIPPIRSGRDFRNDSALLHVHDKHKILAQSSGCRERAWPARGAIAERGLKLLDLMV